MNIQTKYELLSPEAQKQIESFLDFLLNGQRDKNGFNMAIWKEKIKSIPQWSEEDLAIFEENRQKFNQWPSAKW